MTLTEHQRAVLAHVLIEESPDDWLARVTADLGAAAAGAALAAKVAQHEADYLAAVALAGADYETAAQRHAAEIAAMAARDVAAEAERAAHAAALQAALQQAIASGDAAELARLLAGGAP